MDGELDETDGGIDFPYCRYHLLIGYYGDLKLHGA